MTHGCSHAAPAPFVSTPLAANGTPKRSPEHHAVCHVSRSDRAKWLSSSGVRVASLKLVAASPTALVAAPTPARARDFLSLPIRRGSWLEVGREVWTARDEQYYEGRACSASAMCFSVHFIKEKRANLTHETGQPTAGAAGAAAHDTSTHGW